MEQEGANLGIFGFLEEEEEDRDLLEGRGFEASSNASFFWKFFNGILSEMGVILGYTKKYKY